jgi:hypothetical protein
VETRNRENHGARAAFGRIDSLGLLTVYSTLGTFYVLTRSGEVLVDRDDGVLRPADEAGREFAYVQAARRFPELCHLMPERPRSARTCEHCDGSGEIAVHDGRNLLCCPDCNTRGWTVAP